MLIFFERPLQGAELNAPINSIIKQKNLFELNLMQKQETLNYFY